MGFNLNKLLKILFLVALLFLFYLNSSFWHSTLLGIIFLSLFFVLTNNGYKEGLVKFFTFSNNARANLVACFLNFIILSWGWGILIIFWRLNNETFLIPFFLSILISWGLSFWTKKSKENEVVEKAKVEVVTEMPKNHLHIVFFFLIWFAGLYALKSAIDTTGAITPWEIVSKNYIYLIFLLFIILFGLVLARFKTGLLLFLTILLAFLFSSLLPFTSKYIYGADGWRHIASENQILSGEKFEPIVYSVREESLIQKINPGRFSYAQFWGASTGLSKTLNIDLINFTCWFLPVLWSLFFVLFIFELGVALGLTETQGLLLALLGFWPFALQSIGFFSLPVSLGFLTFLFLLLLWVKKKKNPRKEQLFILISLGALSIFGYLLYFLIFWLIFITSGFLSLVERFSSKILNVLASFLVFVLATIFIPVLEIFSGYSNWSLRWPHWWDGIKQFLGNISAFYLASGPREHSIDTGNIFFYQTPSYAFWPNGLTIWRYWLVFFMFLVVVSLVVGLIKFLKSRETVYRVWALVSTGLFSGYLISRYFLSGENILARRLDASLALFFLVIIFFSTRKLWQRKKLAIVLVLLCAAVISTSYSLGPVSRAVSEDEYLAANYALENISDMNNSCVVGDTYPLLVLEALSGKKIVGGGFPIDEYFAQPDLVNIYQGFLNNQNIYYFNEAKKISGANHCIFIVPSGIIKEEVKNFQENRIEIKSFNSVSVLKI